MSSLKTYVKSDQVVYVSDKFIYLCETYFSSKNLVYALEEKYYVSDKPIKLKKKDLLKKNKNYSLFRFFTLEFAPENYLINNGFKQK